MTCYVTALGKGGTTKTTTVSEIAAELSRRGRRVLAIDGDQQGNLSTRLGVTGDTEVEAVTSDVLTGAASIEEAAIASPTVSSVDVVVGTHDLSRVDTREVPDLVTALRDQLPQVDGRWDDVVIDTPPALGDLTLAALAAADVVVVPTPMEVEALDQVERLAGVITHSLARRVKPGLEIGWIIPTRHDPRRLLDREILEVLTESYKGRVTSPVREAIAVRDAYTAGQPVSVFKPAAKVAEDYVAALRPVLEPSLGGTK